MAELIAQGREAEVFLRDDGRVLKLFRDAAYRDRAERELAALSALATAGVAAPTAYEIVEVDGRPGLVMDRIDGADLLTALGSRPYLVFRAGRALGTAHAAMHAVAAPDSLPELNADLRRRIEGAAAGPLDANLADFALDVLSTRPHGDRLCHGDFHLGNILGDFVAPVTIDWGDASRGDPTADVARTELLHRYGELPPGAPLMVRALAKVGRGILVRRYMATYRKLHPVDPDELKRWEIVRAAARFIEGIEAEHEPLTRFLTAAKRA
jgi:aminoglycoside phosphotransferase (APT) family kinase protein